MLYVTYRPRTRTNHLPNGGVENTWQSPEGVVSEVVGAMVRPPEGVVFEVVESYFVRPPEGVVFEVVESCVSKACIKIMCAIRNDLPYVEGNSPRR